MKNIHTAPLEVLSPKANGPFVTEPHEAGWADEAIAVVYVHEKPAGPSPRLVLRAQISADGVRWINFTTPALTIENAGGDYLTLTRFGNWLRLAGEVTGGPTEGKPAFLLDVYWVLKG
jgi:hypothetical protein